MSDEWVDDEAVDDEAYEAEARLKAKHVGDVSPDGAERRRYVQAFGFGNVFLEAVDGMLVPPVAEQEDYVGGLVLVSEQSQLSLMTGMAMGPAICFEETRSAAPTAVEAGWKTLLRSPS